MSPVVLAAKGLRKEYQRLFKPTIVAVESISFEVKKGEIVGLLGPNGAGKTTTFQMLLGVLTPTSGQVYFFGQPLTSSNRSLLEKVNFSSTYTNLPWQLTVHEALTYFSHLYTIKNRSQRVMEVIAEFGLEKLANLQVRMLSSGQLTKLNLAKAYLNKPEILFLDEPTASLDPETGDFLRSFLLADAKKHNTTILLASHNMAEVSKLCDRVLFLHQGLLLADDKPSNLAKKVGSPRLEFKVINNISAVSKICTKLGYELDIVRSMVKVSVPEKKISYFLGQLIKYSIIFEQLKIIEPTLEDYFLAKARIKKKYV